MPLQHERGGTVAYENNPAEPLPQDLCTLAALDAAAWEEVALV